MVLDRVTARAPASSCAHAPDDGPARSGRLDRTRPDSRAAAPNNAAAVAVPAAGPPPSIRARPSTPGPAIQVRLTTPVSRALAAGSASSGTLCTVAAASAG